jgi:predicted translin family RNA/ssDNA-binding protein
MENPSLDELRDEIAELEGQAARLSARRGQLHHRIDFGFETSTTREREREISDERKELHERIDSLKEALRLRESAA